MTRSRWYPFACPDRRRLLQGLPAAAAMPLLAGCGALERLAGRSPPQRLLHLPLALAMADPAAADDVTDTSLAHADEVWSLWPAVALPEYLAREAVVVAHGDGALDLLPGLRWAEPLRDALPRLLRHDLARLRGADSVWPAPAPAGVAVARLLRLEVSALHAEAARDRVLLNARWTLEDPRRLTPPRLGTAEIAVTGAAAERIAAAHRQVLWRLAQRVAAS